MLPSYVVPALNAPYPKTAFLLPVVKPSPASPPTITFWSPVVIAPPALYPTAVL